MFGSDLSGFVRAVMGQGIGQYGKNGKLQLARPPKILHWGRSTNDKCYYHRSSSSKTRYPPILRILCAASQSRNVPQKEFLEGSCKAELTFLPKLPAPL